MSKIHIAAYYGFFVFAFIFLALMKTQGYLDWGWLPLLAVLFAPFIFSVLLPMMLVIGAAFSVVVLSVIIWFVKR